MTWFRVDDSIADHPKTIALKSRRGWQSAFSLWSLAGSHCSRHLTDGYVSASVVKHLGFTPRDAANLVACSVRDGGHGFWEVAENGWRYHNWARWQPTKEQVSNARARNAERQARSRDTRDTNGSNAVTNAVTNGSVAPSVTLPRPVLIRKPVLDPNPDPSVRDQNESEGGAAPPRRKRAIAKDPMGNQIAAAAIWDAYRVAYAERYGAEPLRNARVNGQIAHLAKRLPAADAAHVVASYLRSNNARYVASGHSIGALLQDAEKLHTEAVTGTRTTATAAHRVDKHEDRMSQYQAMFDKLDELERAQGKEPHALL